MGLFCAPRLAWHPHPGFPDLGGHRGRGALCRYGAFRRQADPLGMAGDGLPFPGAWLFRPGRACPAGTRFGRESVLLDGACRARDDRAGDSLQHGGSDRIAGLISGAFSLTHQAMQLGFFPGVRVRHTAHDVEGQIYVPAINFLTGVGAVILVLVFRRVVAAGRGLRHRGRRNNGESHRSCISWCCARHGPGRLSRAVPVLVLFLSFDIPFVAANLGKFAEGGYVPILIGAALLFVMLVWNRGRTLLAHRSRLRFPIVGGGAGACGVASSGARSGNRRVPELQCGLRCRIRWCGMSNGAVRCTKRWFF